MRTRLKKNKARFDTHIKTMEDALRASKKELGDVRNYVRMVSRNYLVEDLGHGVELMFLFAFLVPFFFFPSFLLSLLPSVVFFLALLSYSSSLLLTILCLMLSWKKVRTRPCTTWQSSSRR